MPENISASTFRVYLGAGLSFAFEIDQMDNPTPEQRLESAVRFLDDVKRGTVVFDTTGRAWTLTPETHQAEFRTLYR